MTPSTLRGRLALSALLISAVALAAVALGFNVLLRQQLSAQADEVLTTRASAAVALVRPTAGGRLEIAEPPDDESLDTNLWIYQGNRAVERPPGPASIQAVADDLAGQRSRFRTVDADVKARLYALPVLDGSRRVGTVVTALSLDPYQRSSRQALLGSAAAAVVLLVGSYLLTRLVVRRTLRPVTQMTHQAAEWSASDAGGRFGGDGRAEELSDLAVHLDALLARQAALLRHEQQLTAELSHELRTPLAIIVAELDLLDRQQTEPAEQLAHRAIGRAADRMSGILETLLAQARSGVGTPGRCRLDRAVERTVAASHPAQARRPRVGQIPPVVVGADDTLVERMLSPLLDNACRYARHHVDVAVDATDPECVTVTVTDDGPGLEPDMYVTVFEPGVRLDPDDGHDGAGLGLALARRLARASGGDIRVADRTGGCAFVLSLPQA